MALQPQLAPALSYGALPPPPLLSMAALPASWWSAPSPTSLLVVVSIPSMASSPLHSCSPKIPFHVPATSHGRQPSPHSRPSSPNPLSAGGRPPLLLPWCSTYDVHLDCESKIAKFLGTPDSILYSYGISTIFSVIPAFYKKGDIIVADEGVHWAVQNGLHLSRSTVVYFKHNDMASLASTLEKLTRGNKRAEKIRRYIVVESIYQNSGQIAPLDEIVRLKEKYRFHVILEESHSFGVLGKSGCGLAEHYGVPVSVWPQLFLMFHRNAPPVVSDWGALLPSSQTRPNCLVKCLGQTGQQEWSHGTSAGGLRQRQPMYPMDSLVLT
ncbi:Long chain base biosynthesis protein 1a [Zea mays]|uniref:serine C-palmitoyltransferase n=1 Tax=Zea mays TaxID=4577 RepID=A0A3L6EXJ8_MAIZE|nr:Long chain base biosynthesis protein 1a [Zea mays]